MTPQVVRAVCAGLVEQFMVFWLKKYCPFFKQLVA